MAKVKDFNIKIPNLGEAQETEIIEVNIKIGDKVELDDPLIVLESEKAAMEVPAEYQGEIKKFLSKRAIWSRRGWFLQKSLQQWRIKKMKHQLKKSSLNL